MWATSTHVHPACLQVVLVLARPEVTNVRLPNQTTIIVFELYLWLIYVILRSGFYNRSRLPGPLTSDHQCASSWESMPVSTTALRCHFLKQRVLPSTRA